MLTLWDLVPKRKKKRKPDVEGGPAVPHGRASVEVVRQEDVSARPNRRPEAPMAERYEALTRDMLREHNVRVRKWRTGMTGVAWQVTYTNGRIARLIEAPRPRGPMSAAVFLHEIGHHAIGFNVYRPRCLEEYHAWAWALAQMEARGLNITDAVQRRVHESLWYAVDKARRRGLQRVPPELAAFTMRPPRRQRRRSARASQR